MIVKLFSLPLVAHAIPSRRTKAWVSRAIQSICPQPSPRLGVSYRVVVFDSLLVCRGLSGSTGSVSLRERCCSSQGALGSRLGRPVVNARDHDLDKMKQFLTSLRDAPIIGSPTLTLGGQASSGD